MRIPPIVFALLFCVVGYAAVALALWPNADDTLAEDRAADELKAYLGR